LKITDIITKQDLGEPYDRLSDFLELDDIVRLEQEYGGRQIMFRRHCADIKADYPELYITLGLEKAGEVMRALGDMRVYFPALRRSASDKIRDLIVTEFNGYNYYQLARKYGYTERNIRHILSASGKIRCRVDENQLSFADL